MSLPHPTAQPITPTTLGPLIWIRRHPVLTFYVLAFSATWLSWLPMLLGQDGLGMLPFTPSYYVFGPLGVIAGPWLSAMLVTAMVDGRPGVLNLLRGYTRWRVGIRWYLFMLLPTIVWIIAGLLVGATSLNALVQQWPLIFSVYLPFEVFTLIQAQLWEEVGWRGFAFPRLQSTLGPLWATLLVGALAGLWHLPGFFFGGGITPPGTPAPGITIPVFVLYIMSIALFGALSSWAYNHTEGSLLVIILFHTSLNAGRELMKHLNPDPAMVARATLVESGILLVLALLVIVFTRGKLGYTPDHAAEPTDAPLISRTDTR